MSFVPLYKNIDKDANLVEVKGQVRPTYSQLSTATRPTPDATDEGQTLEETDTGSRYRWTGTIWIQTHLKGALNVHDADVHNVPVNELFHRHTGTATTLAAATIGGVTQTIHVVSGVGFANGDPIQIDSATTIEPTFPTILSGGGTTSFVLDRPIDTTFAIGDSETVCQTGRQR